MRALVIVLCALPTTVFAQATHRAGVDSKGLQADASSGQVRISGDGRWIAFESAATNLVGGDTNGAVVDVFVRDLSNGTTRFASLSSSGAHGALASRAPSLSFDGRFVAFESDADNFDANDTNGLRDVFVRDRMFGTTRRVSTAAGGADPDGASARASISGDGDRIAFESYATNLAVNATSPVRQVYVFERSTNTTYLASQSTSGVAGANDSGYAQMSSDGRFVVFASAAPNLVPNDTNANTDIFVRDLALSTTTRVSVRSDGTEGIGFFQWPAISADGRFTAFETLSGDLVGGDSNQCFDIYVHDALLGSTVRASLSSTATQGHLHSYRPAISADGRFLAWQSAANDFVHNDTNGSSDVFWRDLATGITRRVSVATSGAEGDSSSFSPSMSADGTRIAFLSDASTLVSGDTNASIDVFVRDLSAQGPPIESYGVAKTNSLGCAPVIGASGLPRASGDDAFFVTAARVRAGLTGLLLWSLAPAATPFGGGTLLVGAPITRTSPQAAGAAGPSDTCVGTYAFRFTHAYFAAHGLAPGTTVHCQWWSRDPALALDPIGLTDALRFTVIP